MHYRFNRCALGHVILSRHDQVDRVRQSGDPDAIGFIGKQRHGPTGTVRLHFEDAVTRFGLNGITAIHRYGAIPPGGNIVLVVAAAPHRQAAFDGASFLMDFLKTDAPFWKKEHLKDGGAGEWVSAKDADDKAKLRWRTP